MAARGKKKKEKLLLSLQRLVELRIEETGTVILLVSLSVACDSL